MKTSVIIPTYNRAHLLPRAVQSIPRAVDAEIIIIDDASTDDTHAVVTALQHEDARIRFVPLSENRGVNYARNRGIEIATSEWIQLLDSDDAFVPGGAERVGVYLDTTTDANVVGFMTLREVNGVMEPRGYRVGQEWKTARPTYEDIALKRNIRGDVHYAIRRSVFAARHFFEDTRGFETEFFALIAKQGARFLYVNETVDQRYSGTDYHLSDEPFKKYPRAFACGYKRFVLAHKTLLQAHPGTLRHYYLRIAKCLLATGNPLGVWWALKGALIRTTS
ncbi:MAG: hypothetical protein B7X04_00590 [Parcubacteria group bacterium 21-54-25]|nr:MAG: hypothetical protein B7X04_00590 [Parcubacteria group bacterium 21-54-25]HQU07448.1 glycosyltransferase family 2 protein [Candidatus Paceibacterota bacterium]